jgi:hypothetical protein
MGTINVTPGDLTGAAATLQRAGGGLSKVGVRTMNGGAGDLGAPALDQAVVDLCDRSLDVAMALWNAVSLTGANLAASASAYTGADHLGPH